MNVEFIKSVGNIYSIEKSWDESLIELNKFHAKLISSEKLAKARIATGTKLDTQKGSYVQEGLAYSKEVSLLISNSPLQNIELAKQAVLANKGGNYFKLNDKKLFEKYLSRAEKEERSKKDMEQRKVLILPSDETFNISRTKNWEVARFLLRQEAEKYFNLLETSKYNINSINFYLVSKETINQLENLILTQLWFYGLGGDCRSGLDGDDRYLGCNSLVRGWSPRSCEATKPSKNFQG